MNEHSRPSDLKITDVRTVDLSGVPFGSSLVRLDTNQGISGYGEIRDGASTSYALMLKNRLLGENPCDVDRLFRRIKQFGHHGRQGGGVSGVEIALMDLAGRADGVPVYQLLGGKFRDRILCYCDTPSDSDGTAMGRHLRQRMDMGFRYLKMDVGLGTIAEHDDCVIAPPGMLDSRSVMHPFTGIQLTEKGIGLICEYVAAVRDEIGYEVPLAVDHFGDIGLESCSRLGKALDQFSLAWYEDMIPWQCADQWERLANSVDTPVCTGEDIYLKEGFTELFERRAIAVVHPDLATAGGMMETKKIGDLAQDRGITMALHMAMSPVAAMASVHCAAATENFLVLENHSVDDIERGSGLVEGLPQPLVQDGHIEVPDTPGLGFIGLSEQALETFANPQSTTGIFSPSDQWDGERSSDRLWS